MKLYYLTGLACVLDALALLSFSGLFSDGLLPIWVFAALAAACLFGGVVLYQLTAKLYVEERRKKRRTALCERLDKLWEEQKRGA